MCGMKNLNTSKICIGFAFCIYIISGCSKSSSSNNNCNFSTGSGTAAAGAQVTYAASGTGSASVSSITYNGVNGTVKVSNPSLPWSTSINFPNGGPVGISAVGTASNGAVITLAYGVNASGSFSADTVACGH
jgi:hypothetical protein